jgi:hypothetical protein
MALINLQLMADALGQLFKVATEWRSFLIAQMMAVWIADTQCLSIWETHIHKPR